MKFYTNALLSISITTFFKNIKMPVAKFEFDGSNLIGKKQHSIDTLSIDGPVSKIIVSWDK